MFQTFYRRFYQNTTNHVMGSRADHDKSRYEAYSVNKVLSQILHSSKQLHSNLILNSVLCVLFFIFHLIKYCTRYACNSFSHRKSDQFCNFYADTLLLHSLESLECEFEKCENVQLLSYHILMLQDWNQWIGAGSHLGNVGERSRETPYPTPDQGKILTLPQIKVRHLPYPRSR